MTMTYLPTVKDFSPQKLMKPTHVNLLEIFISSSNENRVKLTPHTCNSKWVLLSPELYNYTSPTFLFP